jgi:hypothetical protein
MCEPISRNAKLGWKVAWADKPMTEMDTDPAVVVPRVVLMVTVPAAVPTVMADSEMEVGMDPIPASVVPG